MSAFLAAHRHLDRCHCCDKGFHGGGRHDGVGVPPGGRHGNMNSICVHICVCVCVLKYTLKQQTHVFAAHYFQYLPVLTASLPACFFDFTEFCLFLKFLKSHKLLLLETEPPVSFFGTQEIRFHSSYCSLGLRLAQTWP